MRTARIAALPAALALAAIALGSCALPDMGERVALVYGVANYDTAGDLSYTDDDAVDMESLLLGRGWLDVRMRLDAGVTKAAIAADIASLGAEGIGGLVLFYYSGHGTSDGSSSYICPVETSVADYGTMISEAELRRWFADAGLKHVVVILDSCDSGGFVEPGATADAIPPVFGLNGDGVSVYSSYLDAAGDAVRAYVGYRSGSDCIALSAAGAGEVSLEGASAANGFFTYFLAHEAPRYADADGDGWITTGEIYSYASRRLIEYLGPYQDYHPHLSGSPREYALFRAGD